MAKKRDLWSLPPEGLWVSPTGENVNINEHLMGIRDNPMQFDIPESEVAPLRSMSPEDHTDGLLRIADKMISRGWTRYQYLDGVYHFEVDDAKRRVLVMDDVLHRAGANPQESLFVSQVLSSRVFKGTVESFFERTFFRVARKNVKPDSWAFSSRKGWVKPTILRSGKKAMSAPLQGPWYWVYLKPKWVLKIAARPGNEDSMGHPTFWETLVDSAIVPHYRIKDPRIVKELKNLPYAMPRGRVAVLPRVGGGKQWVAYQGNDFKMTYAQKKQLIEAFILGEQSRAGLVRFVLDDHEVTLAPDLERFKTIVSMPESEALKIKPQDPFLEDD